jgi:hypothetical protein
VNPLQTRFEVVLEWLEEDVVVVVVVVVVVRRVLRLDWGLADPDDACCAIKPPRNFKEPLLSVA